MPDYIGKTFNRADLQVIREVFLSGIGDENSIDKRPYKQKLDEESKPMLKYLETTYPDGEKRDMAFEDICKATTAYEEVYFELRLKCGAGLLHQLLFEHEPR